MCAYSRTFQMFHAFIALLFALLMITKAVGVPIRCLERERTALLQLKQGLIDEDGHLSSWSGEECCIWQGIRCSNLTAHVLTLDLHSPPYSDGFLSHGLRLRGNLTFSSLAELHHLTYLDLSYNDFFPSQIPESIGSLKELRYLNLSMSDFAGKIPHHQIGNLTHLQTLDLGFNLQGLNVDNIEWLSNLRAIRYLDLSYIDLSNTNWVQSIQNLSFLTELKLPYCELSSPLTPLTNSSYMQTLDLAFNEKLYGYNFEWLSNLRTIRYLDLSGIDLSNTNWLQPIQKLSLLTELHLRGCSIRSLLPPLTNSSYMPLLSVIDLSFNHFNSSSQPLFHWFYNLTSSLVHLDISSNFYLQAGPIPDVFSNMIYLQYLSLSGCSFEGMIPDYIGNITRLHFLDLSLNSLTGNLSEVLNKWSPGAKNSIEVLRLSSNELSGPVPDCSRFSSLKELTVSSNKLNDPFPESFGLHPSLVSLHLSNNQISRWFPNPLSFPNLKHLYIRNNTLKGRLNESIGHFSELITLDISLNSFEDTITEIHFMKLSKLRELDMSFNSLVFDVSSDWIPPFQLDSIALENFKLGPHFPNWLRTQTRFSELHIPHANISDAVPNWFWKLSPRLAYLNLASNQMSGVIPDLSSFFTQLLVIDLSSNHFNGPLPLIPPCVIDLLLSKNMFVGSISSVCDIARIGDLDLSDNRLSGELPDCWKKIDQLETLNLANNNFTGEIPSSLGFLNSLEYLHLKNNSFIGKLPPSLKHCRWLKIVDLGGNKLSGKIPEWIGIYMNDLAILSLSQNKFYGSIPQNICNLNRIQVLDLSQNSISGYIPRCFNNFTALMNMSEVADIYYYEVFYYGASADMSEVADIYYYRYMYFENVEVQWKGQRAGYGKTLGLLNFIDLSSNNLTGEIPVELVSLIRLQSLNLSRNCFRGHIPEKIGQMKNLESLDLSRNLLSGQIPLELASLSYLSVLDLSNNNLSGRIPSGTQLQGFNSSVYAGNQQLCGLPLSNKCPGDREAPTSKDKNGEDDDDDGDDELITLGFYVSLILGFAFGFWGVFGTLQLKHAWRRAFFQFLSDMKDKVYVVAAVNVAKIKRMRTG